MRSVKFFAAATALVVGCASTGTTRGGARASGAVATAGVEAASPQVAHGDSVFAGTTLRVRLDEAVGAGATRRGERFHATVLTGVVDARGRAVIPAGSRVSGYVADVRQGDGSGARPALALAVDTVEIDGRPHPIRARAIGPALSGASGAGFALGLGGAHAPASGGGAPVHLPAGSTLTIQLEQSVPVASLRGASERGAPRAIGGGPQSPFAPESPFGPMFPYSSYGGF